MINAEKLLGKVVEEVIGSGHGIKKLKKKKKKKKKKSSLLSSLSSGAGLMTAIGLGVGAYEILKDKSKQQTYGGTVPHPQAGGAPTGTQAGQSSPPPPPPPPPEAESRPVPSPPPQTMQPAEVEGLAIKLIQVMIAAAHADGTMDEEEESAVIERLKGESFSREEKMFLLGEMHNPKSLDQFTAGITDQATAKVMYALAVGTIEIDTPQERQWLDALALRLGLSPAVQAFIEEEG